MEFRSLLSKIKASVNNFRFAKADFCPCNHFWILLLYRGKYCNFLRQRPSGMFSFFGFYNIPSLVPGLFVELPFMHSPYHYQPGPSYFLAPVLWSNGLSWVDIVAPLPTFCSILAGLLPFFH